MRTNAIDALEATGREHLLAVLRVPDVLVPKVSTRALAHLAQIRVRFHFGPKDVPPERGTLGAFFSSPLQGTRIELYENVPISPWVVAHEIGHALDCALSEGWTPFSRVSHSKRREWLARLHNHEHLNTRCTIDPAEWFAEAYRCWVGENDGALAPIPQSKETVLRMAPEFAAMFQKYGL